MEVLNKEKFENTVLAILKAKPMIGSLQLRKALIIADALHFQLYGESLTGAKYIKKQYGPVPDNEASHALRQMEFPLNKVEIIETPAGPFTKIAYMAVEEPDYSAFTPEQRKIINFAARTACKYTASRLSDMTHDENYRSLPMGAPVRLDTVCAPSVSGYETEPMTRAEKEAVRKFLESDEARLYSFR
jgi:hypothetical protein